MKEGGHILKDAYIVIKFNNNALLALHLRNFRIQTNPVNVFYLL